MFGDATVYSVSGGSGSYVAVGVGKMGGDAVWVSRDGRAWTPSTLPTIAPAKLLVSDAVAYSGGYVLGGAVEGDGGCGGPSLVMPSVWSSPDGRAWTRRTLPGATPGNETSMQLARIGDGKLLAMQETWKVSTQTSIRATWVSNDGRSWRRVKAESVMDADLLSNGVASLVLLWKPDAARPLTIMSFDASDNLATLAQVGNPPPGELGGTAPWSATFGPTGLLMCDPAGASCRIAVPH